MRIDDTDPDELDDLDTGWFRRRWKVVVGSLAVVAAFVAGLLLLRGDDDEPAVVETVPVVVPETDPPDTLPVDAPPPPLNAFPDFGSDFVGEPLELLYQRVTDAGIRVAVHDNGNWMQFEGDAEFGVVPATIAIATEDGAAAEDTTAVAETVAPAAGFAPPDPVPPQPVVPGWVPADWCFPAGGMRVSMTYKDAIGVSNGSRYAAVRDGGMMLTLFSSGYAENQHFRVLVLQVEEGTTLATATWADGAVDAAVPVKGWVVLATPGEAAVEFDISLQAGDGVRNVLYDELPRDGDAAWLKACNPPPPELPAPGVQPDDPAAAEQEVRDVFDLLWNRDIPLDEKVVLDDTTGVAEAIDQVDSGGFAETAETAEHTITEVVFTSPNEAWFMYDLNTDITNFTNRFGIAYRIDGVWVIARAVICQDLGLAGGQCIPFADEIRPPGS